MSTATVRKAIVRTGVFVKKLAHTPGPLVDRRCRVIPFPKRGPRRDPSLWRVKACQWIDGDPIGRTHDPALFCGCAVKPGSSYCEAHHRRAYIPGSAMRTDKAVKAFAEFKNGSAELWDGIGERGRLYHGADQLPEAPVEVELGLAPGHIPPADFDQ